MEACPVHATSAGRVNTVKRARGGVRHRQGCGRAKERGGTSATVPTSAHDDVAVARRVRERNRRHGAVRAMNVARVVAVIDGDGELGRRRIAPKPLADVLDVGVRELEHLREVVDHSGVDRAAPGVRMVREGDAPGLALRAEEVELERRIVVLLS